MQLNPSQIGARHGRGRQGFTLVEILIVLVILGILASIVIPQFSNASHQARENTLRDAMRYMRTQISVYKAQHKDVAPGQGGGNFILQMTMPTDEAGNTNAVNTPIFKFGAYLLRIPYNPINNLDSIMISNSADVTTDIDDTTGWIYNPDTQQFVANLSGSDTSGTPYAQY